MSFGSPADIIPFTRFLECRQRRNRLATAHATAVMAASTDGGVPPEVIETPDDDDGAPPRGAYEQASTRRSRSTEEAESDPSVVKCF